eukprot:6628566-Alexandrium_andersonii.AAC.1
MRTATARALCFGVPACTPHAPGSAVRYASAEVTSQFGEQSGGIGLRRCSSEEPPEGAAWS